ncbi:arsenate reductase (glutaredoxin) [Wenyingzhuangia sp. IMCC45533]
MIEIYHNPRCSKSRQGVAYLKERGVDFLVVKYLDNSLTEDDLTRIVKILDISPMDLIRKNEAVWKSEFRGKNLTDGELIKAMIINPKLIERPIVINNDKGVVARPADLIDKVL